MKQNGKWRPWLLGWKVGTTDDKTAWFIVPQLMSSQSKRPVKKIIANKRFGEKRLRYALVVLLLARSTKESGFDSN